MKLLEFVFWGSAGVNFNFESADLGRRGGGLGAYGVGVGCHLLRGAALEARAEAAPWGVDYPFEWPNQSPRVGAFHRPYLAHHLGQKGGFHRPVKM